METFSRDLGRHDEAPLPKSKEEGLFAGGAKGDRTPDLMTGSTVETGKLELDFSFGWLIIDLAHD